VRDLIIRGCWLWPFADPPAIEDHFYNIRRDKKFLEHNLYSKHGRWLEGGKLNAAAQPLKSSARNEAAGSGCPLRAFQLEAPLSGIVRSGRIIRVKQRRVLAIAHCAGKQLQ
jgi:hypothetical protein